MSRYANRNVYFALEANSKHTAILKAFVDYEPTPETIAKDPNNQGFMVFKFELEDGRILSETRNFPVGTDILVRELALQLGLPNASNGDEVFTHAVDSAHPFDMWVEPNGTYLNNVFHQPVAKPVSQEEAKANAVKELQATIAAAKAAK